MREIDTQFKNFLRTQAGARGHASLTDISEIPATLRDGEFLADIAANCAKLLNAMAAGFKFDPWVAQTMQKPFPRTAVLKVQHQWVLSRLALIEVLEDQLKWMTKTESPEHIRISLAHTTDYALALCTLGVEIGGDIEPLTREISDAVKTRLQPREDMPALEQWVAKESAFKSDIKNKTALTGAEFKSMLDYEIIAPGRIKLVRETSTEFTYQTLVWENTHHIAWAIPAIKK